MEFGDERQKSMRNNLNETRLVPLWTLYSSMFGYDQGRRLKSFMKG